MKIAIVILAAGSSSRMGEPKQLLPYKNTTLLGNTIENAMQSLVDKVFCVLGANYEVIKQSIKKYDVEIICNPNFKNGLSSSIKEGVEQAKNFDAILISLADQPFVESSFLNELIQLSQENPTKIIASDYGKRVGVPAVFPKNHYQKLLTLKGDSGAGKFLNSSKIEVIKLECNSLIDIDTKEDYIWLSNEKTFEFPR